MDLIPVPADDDDDDGELPRLSVSPRAAALMQVEVWPVERRAVEAPVRLYGRIEADETRLRTVSAWAPGRLERLHVDATGATVRAGQPMVELYSPQLIAAQDELLQTLRAERELATGGIGIVHETTVSRSRRRVTASACSGSSGADRPAGSRRPGRDRSPFRRRSAASSWSAWPRRAITSRPGSHLPPRRPVQAVAAAGGLRESTSARWRSGARCVHDGEPAGNRFEGTVAFIEPVVGAARTVRVRVEVANPDGRLKPGMFARGVAIAEAGAAGLPRAAGHSCVRAAGHRTTGAGVRAAAGRRAADLRGARGRAGRARGRMAGGHRGPGGRRAGRQSRRIQDRCRAADSRPAQHDAAGRGRGGRRGGGAGAAPAAFRAQLGAVVEAQFELVRALAADDPDAARAAAAGRGCRSLHATDATVLEGRAARETWNQRAKEMHEGIKGVAAPPISMASESISSLQRRAHRRGAGLRGRDPRPVYRAMCPMVRDAKASGCRTRSRSPIRTMARRCCAAAPLSRKLVR
jgi:membrane fusion protein, copper/silver efflux system